MRRTEKAVLLRRGAYQLKNIALAKMKRILQNRADADDIIALVETAIDAAIATLYPQPLEFVLPPTAACPHNRVRGDNYGETCLDCGAQVSIVT